MAGWAFGARELRLLDGGDQPQLIAGNLRFVAVGRVLHLSQIGATAVNRWPAGPIRRQQKARSDTPFVAK
jgi:hypothetical protein